MYPFPILQETLHAKTVKPLLRLVDIRHLYLYNARPCPWQGFYWKIYQESDMAPLPKQKTSKGRRDRRRAHDALEPKNLTQCSNCGHLRLPHTVCPHCGFYQGREIYEVDQE